MGSCPEKPGLRGDTRAPWTHRQAELVGSFAQSSQTEGKRGGFADSSGLPPKSANWWPGSVRPNGWASVPGIRRLAVKTTARQSPGCKRRANRADALSSLWNVGCGIGCGKLHHCVTFDAWSSASGFRATQHPRCAQECVLPEHRRSVTAPAQAYKTLQNLQRILSAYLRCQAHKRSLHPRRAGSVL